MKESLDINIIRNGSVTGHNK